jgi:uncharacterized membrane protein
MNMVTGTGIEEGSQQRSRWLWYFLISTVIIIVIVLWVVSPFVIHMLFKDWNQSGVFGDSYGAVNALFSGLALGGVIVAILLQSQELRHQREELSLTREVQKESSVAQQGQLNMLATTARLNALSTIVEYHMRMSDFFPISGSGARLPEALRESSEHIQLTEAYKAIDDLKTILEELKEGV